MRIVIELTCCSGVELEELDSLDDMDIEAILARTVGTKKSAKRRKINKDLNLI